MNLESHGADCTIAVEPTRPIEGIVRDAETREPIAGAVVTGFQLCRLEARHRRSGIEPRPTRRAVIGSSGCPRRADGHKLAVYPPLDRPYFITRCLEVPAGPGFDPVHFDIALEAGIWITGKVDRLSRRESPCGRRSTTSRSCPIAHAKDYSKLRPEHHRRSRSRRATDRPRGPIPHRRPARRRRGHGAHRRQVVPSRGGGRGDRGANGARPAPDVRPHLPGASTRA